jgi:hypothetical protein
MKAVVKDQGRIKRKDKGKKPGDNRESGSALNNMCAVLVRTSPPIKAPALPAWHAY